MSQFASKKALHPNNVTFYSKRHDLAATCYLAVVDTKLSEKETMLFYIIIRSRTFVTWIRLCFVIRNYERFDEIACILNEYYFSFLAFFVHS